jgi:hypothetical protein
LGKVLSAARKPVVYSKYKLQADDADTCGRWAAARIINAEMPLHKFADEMMSGGGTPDQNVTAYTFDLLHK